MNKKIDKDLEAVFQDIVKMIYNEAKSTQSVVEYLKATYGLELSRSYELIREAKLYFATWIAETRAEVLTECIQILEQTRERALEQNNLKEVRECTKEIAKLEQLYIEKHEHIVKGEQPFFGPINNDSKESE